MSIVNKIESISNHLENAYDELQGLGADLTNVNKNIENISMVLDDIYDSLPSVSGEGTSLTLDDTRVGKIKSTLKGNTSQDGTPTPTTPQLVNVVSGDNEIAIEGKNLLGYPTTFEETTNGINITQNKGIYVTSGTTISSENFMTEKGLNNRHTIQTGDYIHVGNNVANSNCAMVLVFSDNTVGSVGLTSANRIYSLENKVGKTIIALRFYCNATNISINMQVKPMIINNVSTSIDFIEYQGNNYDIVLSGLGKNKFNIDSIIRGYELISTTGVIQANPLWWVSDYIPIEPNQTYTSSNISSVNKAWYDKNKKFISRTTTTTAISPSNAKYLRVNGMLDSLKSNPQAQIEEGSSATTFEDYVGIELCKIGNYQDYFYKDNDKWYLHKEIGKIVLDGTQTITINSSSASRTVFEVNNITNLKDYATIEEQGDLPNILCPKFNQVPQNASWASGNISKKRLNQNKVFIIWEANKTIAELETLTNNMPIYYALETPTNTEITYQPLIDQLNELKKAQSKENQTNISQVNNDLPFIINATALMKNSD